MSLWKQNKIRKQQRKKRTNKVLKTRDEVLSLLVTDKVKKAGELASTMLIKYPGDIRVWRLVAGVKAWERFDERIRSFPSRRKDELRSRALKVMRRELTSRDSLRAEVLAETLISLVPAGEVMVEEETPMVAEEVPAVVEAPEEKPAEKAPAKTPAPKKTKTAEAPASKKTDKTKKPAAKEKTKKSTAPKKTETAKKSPKKETAKKSPARKKTK